MHVSGFAQERVKKQGINRAGVIEKQDGESATLRHSRVYKDIYVHTDQTKEERVMSANLRSLVSAYKAWDNNIRVKGSRIVKDDQEGNSNQKNID